MGYGSLDVIDKRLVLQSEDDEDGDSQEMLAQLYRLPHEERLVIIPVLCGLGYWVMHESNIDRTCTFSVHWNHTETKLRRIYHHFFSHGGILHHPH